MNWLSCLSGVWAKLKIYRRQVSGNEFTTYDREITRTIARKRVRFIKRRRRENKKLKPSKIDLVMFYKLLKEYV